jgi:hypothetical protein
LGSGITTGSDRIQRGGKAVCEEVLEATMHTLLRTTAHCPTKTAAGWLPRCCRATILTGLNAGEGMGLAREQARCYLPDAVRLLAGIALAPDSAAALHTRMLYAKQLVEIAGVISTPRFAIALTRCDALTKPVVV